MKNRKDSRNLQNRELFERMNFLYQASSYLSLLPQNTKDSSTPKSQIKKTIRSSRSTRKQKTNIQSPKPGIPKLSLKAGKKILPNLSKPKTEKQDSKTEKTNYTSDTHGNERVVKKAKGNINKAKDLIKEGNGVIKDTVTQGQQEESCASIKPNAKIVKNKKKHKRKTMKKPPKFPLLGKENNLIPLSRFYNKTMLEISRKAVLRL
ncbi:hypothetical protein BB560_001499 [Smittium megazygosporum]|uniref:Uncharacterized protein n=1 Tax=Smittium megazygosporum TaxID=133381 RepID=A0A2T9ZHE6_9FUNG|nr:hypothetical protein BB560_001499 [Smittium megazygosporum]